MDSDDVTHITDSTQNAIPLDETTDDLLEHWFEDPELPMYLNTQHTDDLSTVTNTSQGHVAELHAHILRTYTTMAEATGGSVPGDQIEELLSNSSRMANNENNIDAAIFTNNMSPSQRLANHPTLLDYYFASLAGTGHHLTVSSHTHPHGNMSSNEAEHVLNTRSIHRLMVHQRDQRASADSLIRLFESTTVLYYCTFCDFFSSSFLEWRNHERELHLLSDNVSADSITEDLRCYFCGDDAVNINERAEHIAGHFFWQGYTKDDWDECKVVILRRSAVPL